MTTNYTAELTQLLRFSGDAATAIRMYSKYSGDIPVNSGVLREPTLGSADLMFLSDAITQMLSIADALEQGDPERIADTCVNIRQILEHYVAGQSEAVPSASETFAFWSGLVDVGIAVRALKAIQGKAQTLIALEQA